MSKKPKEEWSSRLGVILAVAGSAVGLGNFLRFPGQAAEYGGGAFMLAYFISFLIIGLPICWAEWTIGRFGGTCGFHSSPGIFNAIWRSRAAKYAGIIGVIIPVVIYMYYVYIEAWCLGYAVNFMAGNMQFPTIEDSRYFLDAFIGGSHDGDALNGFGMRQVGVYLLIAFALNFFLIYRGVSKGIEWFCKYAIPTLVLLAVVVLIRVLTLGTPNPEHPEANVNNGLGFMWNPNKYIVEVQDPATLEWSQSREVVDDRLLAAAEAEAAASAGMMRVQKRGILEQLSNPELWLAAAGQIFFSLSVGFGVIITYSSYLRKDDDIVLSGLAATSANEFCEVALGGLITLPAAVAFLGVAGLTGAGLSTFALGFHVLPMVFSEMPLGQLFGFLWFFLLFLAAVTSSISMLQPGIAFLEETLRLDRKRSVSLLGIITLVGVGMVVWFSEGSKALDTLDFWVGTFLIFVLAMIQIIVFGWVFGLKRGMQEAHLGSAIRIPAFFGPVIRYVCPLFLLTVFIFWVLKNLFGISLRSDVVQYSGYVRDLFIEPNNVAWLSVGFVIALFIFFALIVSSVQRYKDYHKKQEEDAS